MTNNLAWYVARSAGLVGWVLLAIGVFLGLALSTKVLGRRPKPRWVLDLHRFVGGLALIFVALHIAGLMLDQYVHFGVVEVLVPLQSSFRPWAVAAGVVGLYLLIAIELTSLAMRWIPKRWWRAVHSTSFLLFLLTSFHVITAGTDAVRAAVKVVALLLSTTFVFLVTYRWLAPSRGAGRASGRAGANMRTVGAGDNTEMVA